MVLTPLAEWLDEAGIVTSTPVDSLRVKVYAGIDPVTKRKLHLTETVFLDTERQRHFGGHCARTRSRQGSPAQAAAFRPSVDRASLRP